MKRETGLLIALSLVSLAVACSGFAINSLTQEKPTKQKAKSVKLEYGNPDLLPQEGKDLPHPQSSIAVSSNRLLVPAGDTLYMLNDQSEIVWGHSVEPNVIFDVAVDPKGMIYMTVSDGNLLALDGSGREVWHDFMNGSANYTQIKAYGDGLLAVVSMDGYRAKGSNSEDKLVFRKDKEAGWTKEFPREAKLQVWGSKILTIKQIKEGKEITEIR